MAATQENSKVLKVQELVMDFRQFNAPGFLMGIFDPAELTVTLRPGFHKECPVSDAKPVKEIVWDQSSQEWQTRFSISSHTVVCTILNVLECVQLSMVMMGFDADMGEMLYSRLLEQAILDPDPEPDEPFTPLNMSFSPPLLEIDKLFQAWSQETESTEKMRLFKAMTYCFSDSNEFMKALERFQELQREDESTSCAKVRGIIKK